MNKNCGRPVALGARLKQMSSSSDSDARDAVRIGVGDVHNDIIENPAD
ncbi:MAG: hypothetical protein QM817_40165 [Archangium sp.]